MTRLKVCLNLIVLSLALFMFSVAVSSAAEPTLAEAVLSSYARIQSVSALVRKTTEAKGNSRTMLSRVYYQRPDRLHVENITPIRRRLISDGDSFFMFQDGLRRGYSAPINQLSDEWKIMQQSIPGTFMEHLLRLRGVEERELDATDDCPVRRGYQAERVFVVLSADELGRIIRIEFFKDSMMTGRTAIYQFDNFMNVTGDCWLSVRHQAEVDIDGETFRETRRFDNLQVNQPIPPGLFDPQAFFKDVEFVDDLSKLEEE